MEHLLTFILVEELKHPEQVLYFVNGGLGFHVLTVGPEGYR